MTTITKRDSMDANTDALRTRPKVGTPTETVSKKRCLGLVDLPPAIRNNIYKYALDTELVNVGKPNVSYTHSMSDGILHFKASRHPFPVLTALFYVSKQVSNEALQYFFSKNLFVRFEIYSPDARHGKTMLVDSGLLFSTASPEQLEASKKHALELVLVEKNSSQKRATVMFPAQYLPRLINFLDQASRASGTWAPMHSLFINVANSYNLSVARLQGDLLEPFRLLTNLGAVTIDSKHLLPRYAEGLQSSMTSPAFSADAWLQTVTDLADLADSSRSASNYPLATEYAQSSIIALTHGYLTHPETLHTQPSSFAQSVQRLRWRIELGLSIALSLRHQPVTSRKDWLDSSTPAPGPAPATRHAAHDLLLAESAACKALSLATDSPSPASNPWFLSLPVELIPPNKPAFFTDRERAETWYVLGSIHTALGEYIFGCGDFERSLGLWGKEDEGREKVEAVFQKAREGIDGDRENMWVGRVRPGSALKRAARVARGWEGL
ncbi:hypothetical protein ACN47E_007806 [Coniothyrium glycines]